MMMVMTKRTVLKVPFEKAAPSPLPFRRSGTRGFCKNIVCDIKPLQEKKLHRLFGYFILNKMLVYFRRFFQIRMLSETRTVTIF